MKVNMDGLRGNLNGDVERLKGALSVLFEEIEADGWSVIPPSAIEKVKECFDEVAQGANLLNCVFSGEDPTFTDQSHMRVTYFSEDEEE